MEVVGLLAPEAFVLPSAFLALPISMGTVDDLTKFGEVNPLIGDPGVPAPRAAVLRRIVASLILYGD